MALNTDGGPSLTYDIDAPVIVNQTGGEFYKQPLFYAMGHFSKFVPPGSKRVQSICSQSEILENTKKAGADKSDKMKEFISSFKSTSSQKSFKHQTSSASEDFPCIAFVNPDNSYTAVIINL